MGLASLLAQSVKRPPALWEPWVRSLGQEDALEKKWQPTPVFLPEESHGRRSLVVTKSRTRLSDFTFTNSTNCCFSKQRNAACHEAINLCRHSEGAHLGKLRMEKNSMLTLDTSDAPQRTDLREPRFFHLRIVKKF